MKKRAQGSIVLTILLIGILIAVSFGTVTYSYMYVSRSQTGENAITTTCFTTSFTEGQSILLNGGNAYPVEDLEGLTSNPYHFEVSNTCGVDQNYYVVISTKTGSFDNSVIKYSLDGVNSYTLSNSTESSFAKDTGYDYSYIIKTGSLTNGQKVSLDLRLWMDETTVYDTVSNKTWEGQVKVINTVKEHDDNATNN